MNSFQVRKKAHYFDKERKKQIDIYLDHSYDEEEPVIHIVTIDDNIDE